MPRKKLNSKAIEQKEFRVFNPEDVKQSVEILVKPLPQPKELEIIEKRGEPKISPKKLAKRKEVFDKYVLIVTEKPQAAAKIAAALSNGKDKKISSGKGVYYHELERNNKKIIVACAVGHLFSVAQTKKEKGYPIFDIGWYPNFQVKKNDFTKKYYSTIKKLIENAEEIVVASVDYNEKVPIMENRIIKIVKIGDFIDDILDNKKPISNIKVPCFNKKGKISFKKLKKVIRHKIKEDLYELSLEYGRKIKLTSSHNVFKYEKGKINLSKTTNLKIGNEIFCPNSLPNSNEIIKEINLLDLINVKKIKDLYICGKDISQVMKQRVFSKERKKYPNNDLRVIINKLGVQKLKNRREELKLSTKKASEKINLSQPLIVLWENQKRNPSLSNLRRYLKMLNLNSKSFLNKYCKIINSSFNNLLKHVYKNQYKEFSNFNRATLPLHNLKKEEIKKIKSGFIYGSKNKRNKLPIKLKLSKELVRLMGYFLAEGDINNNYRIRFSLGLKGYGHEEKIISEIEEFCNKYDLSCNHYTHKKIGHQIITIDNAVLALFFKYIFQFGNKAINKRVPLIIFNLAPELKKEFLRAYFLGDGSISERNIAFNSNSPDLINDLSYLNLQLGIIGGISKTFSKTSKSKNPTWKFTISKDLKKIKKIWEDHHKSSKVKRVKNNIDKRIKLKDLSLLKIRDIKKIKTSKKYVYDFSVEGENFIAGQGGVCCHNTDFDVEGEVIGYNIVRFIANRKDAKRMKFSSLTTKELQDSYDNQLPTIEWGQAIAGETRHFLDWLYGINLSRALMQAIKTTGKFKIMSIGRVQGPTLHLIVDREKKIKAFKPSPYWQIFITINDKKDKLELKHNKDITKKQNLDKFKDLKGKTCIAKTEKTGQSITPPAPFDLTALQTETYKFHLITPSQTLKIAQRLYLAGLISYPRTSSQKIPDAMKPKEILDKLSKFFPELAKHATKQKPIEGSKSDPAHPAIIPTGNHQRLEAQDEKIYNLIIKRFISCFCDNAELENKKVEVEVEKEYKPEQKDSGLYHDVHIKEKLKFSAKGMEILKPGWMQVYPAKLQEKEIEDFNGEVTIDKVRTEAKQTKPPRRYTPASIISELEKRNLGTKCLTGDTKIFLNNKKTPIKNIFLKGKPYSKEKNLEIREISGKTISLNQKEKTIITKPRLISRRKIREDEKIIKIEIDSSTIKLTEDHLIYIYKNNKIQQIPAKNLQIDDKLIGIIKKHNEGKPIIEKSIFNNNYRINKNEIKHKFSSKTSKGISISKFPIKWSTSLAWILGYYYGDGSYNGLEYNGSHSISFTTTEKKALNLLKENIKNIFGYEPYAYNLGTKYKVDCNSVMAYTFIKTFPQLNGKNPINIPNEFIGDFLRGFFDADGNVHLRPKGKTKIKGIETNSFDTPRVKFTLANEKLIMWIKDLLKQLGIKTKINKGFAKCRGKDFECYTILISGRDKIERFAYLIGFDSYKEKILYKGLKCDSKTYKILQNSSIIVLSLLKKHKDVKQIARDTDLKEYSVSYALKRLQKLGIVSKKKIDKYNWNYYLDRNSKEYINHCMKIAYNNVGDNIYIIPIKSLSNIDYKGHVYDLSVKKDSPNFIIEGNILVHNSTRANIIETLYNRNYIKGKSIEATELGIRLIDSLNKYSPIIIDENLTRKIEKDMDNIRASKKGLEKKQQATIKKAKDTLTKISEDFKKKENEIGKELAKANEVLWKQQKEDNKLNIKCPGCNEGELTIKYTPRFKSYFIACTNYPNCKKTFPLPSRSLIKKADKICEYCNYPMLMRIKQGKRPWIFCFNPDCESRRELNIKGNTKKEEEK